MNVYDLAYLHGLHLLALVDLKLESIPLLMYTKITLIKRLEK